MAAGRSEARTTGSRGNRSRCAWSPACPPACSGEMNAADARALSPGGGTSAPKRRAMPHSANFAWPSGAAEQVGGLADRRARRFGDGRAATQRPACKRDRQYFGPARADAPGGATSGNPAQARVRRRNMGRCERPRRRDSRTRFGCDSLRSTSSRPRNRSWNSADWPPERTLIATSFFGSSGA